MIRSCFPYSRNELEHFNVKFSAEITVTHLILYSLQKQTGIKDNLTLDGTHGHIRMQLIWMACIWH